jgi:hypothetical protein
MSATVDRSGPVRVIRVDLATEASREAAVRAETAAERASVITGLTGEDDAVAHLLATRGTKSESRVVEKIESSLANEPTVVQAAAALAQTDAGLVRRQDPGIPRSAPTESDRVYAEVWTDPAGRVALGILADGTILTPLHEANISRATEFHVGAASKVVEADLEGYLAGTRDSFGRMAENAIDERGRVPDWILKAWAARMGIGALSGMASSLPITTWGDSQTGQVFDGVKGWPVKFAEVLGLSPSDILNRGFPGETSVAVAAKAGAVPAVWLSGGTIPASGPVTMILKDHLQIMRWWSPLPCTIAGVHGTLTRHPDTTGTVTLDQPATFTRDVPGDPVTVPPNSPFLSDWAGERGNMTIIMSGRNNTTDPERVIADTRAHVEFLTGLDGKYLVLSQINGTGRDQINAANRAAYGSRYVDVLSYLASTKALADAGLTPTTQDLADIAAGRVPTAFYVGNGDLTHLNGLGLNTMGAYLAQIVIGKGWIS